MLDVAARLTIVDNPDVHCGFNLLVDLKTVRNSVRRLPRVDMDRARL